MPIAIESRFKEVEKLVVAAQRKDLDAEIAAYYCKLACVMICGTVERSIEILITERIAGKSSPRIGSFLKSFFMRGTNYDCDAIISLLYKFDARWGEKFKAFVEKNEPIKSSLSSCYAVRNSIAHGGTQSLGPSALKQYFDHAFSLIAELEAMLRL